MLLDGPTEEPTAAVAERVSRVRALATERGVPCNARLPPDRLEATAPLTSEARAVLRAALAAGQLTGRGLTRVRTVARTLADLAGSDVLDEAVVAAALSLRAVPTSVLGGQ
jgi:magnesium chelatase family protein